jgi:hypothetical protein
MPIWGNDPIDARGASSVLTAQHSTGSGKPELFVCKAFPSWSADECASWIRDMPGSDVWRAKKGGLKDACIADARIAAREIIEAGIEHGADLRIWGCGMGMDRMVQCSMKTGWFEAEHMRLATSCLTPAQWQELGIRASPNGRNLASAPHLHWARMVGVCPSTLTRALMALQPTRWKSMIRVYSRRTSSWACSRTPLWTFGGTFPQPKLSVLRPYVDSKKDPGHYMDMLERCSTDGRGDRRDRRGRGGGRGRQEAAICGRPGCTFAWDHNGGCSNEMNLGKRQRVPRVLHSGM